MFAGVDALKRESASRWFLKEPRSCRVSFVAGTRARHGQGGERKEVLAV